MSLDGEKIDDRAAQVIRNERFPLGVGPFKLPDMKLLFSLVALIGFSAISHGQTLKWEHFVPNPPVTFTSAFVYFTSDAAGNAAYAVAYGNDGPSVGYALVWLSSTGKILHSAFDEDIGSAEVVSVSSKAAVFQLSRKSDNQSFVRTFKRTGTQIVSSDMELGTSYVRYGATPISATHFFTVQTRAPLSVRRYNIR